MSKPGTDPGNSAAILDSYFALAGRSARYRKEAALEVWSSLTPAEKRTLQQTACKLAGNDLRLGAEHTQSILLLRHLNARAGSVLTPASAVAALEI